MCMCTCMCIYMLFCSLLFCIHVAPERRGKRHARIRIPCSCQILINFRYNDNYPIGLVSAVQLMSVVTIRCYSKLTKSVTFLSANAPPTPANALSYTNHYSTTAVPLPTRLPLPCTDTRQSVPILLLARSETRMLLVPRSLVRRRVHCDARLC